MSEIYFYKEEEIMFQKKCYDFFFGEGGGIVRLCIDVKKVKFLLAYVFF